MAKLPLGIGYAKAYRVISPYVNFQVDTRKLITVAEQRKISKYFREYKKLTANPVHIYKSKKKTNLQFVQKQTGQPKGFPGFKVAFVPVSEEGAKIKISIRKYKNGKRKLVISDSHIIRKTFLFSEYEAEELETLDNPEPTVNGILKDSKGIDQFTLMCGNHETKQSVERQFLLEQVERFTQTYGNAHEWLFGVIGYSFKDQKDINAYRSARNSAKRRKGRKKK